MVIGLISDTHGLVREQTFRLLRDVELILHAGDVGGAAVLTQLAEIAPVHPVRGNIDIGSRDLADRIDLVLGGLRVHVSHGDEIGTPTPLGLVGRYDADVIVFGHTHRAVIERIGRQLIVNPGAAGPGRFRLVPSLGRLTIENGEADAEILAIV